MADANVLASVCHRLAALIKHVSETRTLTIIERLISFTTSKDEGLRDIASLGMLDFILDLRFYLKHPTAAQ